MDTKKALLSLLDQHMDLITTQYRNNTPTSESFSKDCIKSNILTTIWFDKIKSFPQLQPLYAKPNTNHQTSLLKRMQTLLEWTS